MHDILRKRLLICSPGVPHETQGAATVVFWNYIAKLKTLDFEVLNLLFLNSNDFKEEEFEQYRLKMAETARFEIVPLWADQFFRTNRFAITANLAVTKEAVGIGETFQPDAILFLDLLSAWLAGSVKCGAKLVWLGDLNFQTHWYHALYAAKENLRRAKDIPSAWIRSLVWKSIYRSVLSEMDSVMVAAKSSEKVLRSLGIRAVYQPYPWPDHSSARQAAQSKRYTIPSFLFFGNLAGLGSRSAFHFMLTSVYPRLRRIWGENGFQLFIAGRLGLPGFAAELISDKPELKYQGYVEDLGGLMASCHAVLAPIDVPVGNRVRIVTALASGALVIAHRNAALGNPDLIHEKTCLLAGNADEFAECMKMAYEGFDSLKAVRHNARVCWETRFQPDKASDMLAQEILRISSR